MSIRPLQLIVKPAAAGRRMSLPVPLCRHISRSAAIADDAEANRAATAAKQQLRRLVAAPLLSMGRQQLTQQRFLRTTATLKDAKKVEGSYITDLPRLGVPNLEETMAKLVHFAKPVQNPAEFLETVRMAGDFLTSDEGEKLQKLLQKRAKELDNWLTPWWLNIAYLQARTPLPIVTSPGVVLEHLPYAGQDGQIQYAAKIITSILEFHHRILKRSLPQDGGTKTPFDMSQYDNLIGTIRIPRQGCDQIKYGHETNGKHVLVTRRGHTFAVPVYDAQGRALGVQQISQLIRDHVIPKSQDRVESPVNLVSADGRDEWAAVYQRLERTNPREIAAYESALFAVALDDNIPPKPGNNVEDEVMHQALLGGGAHENTINRWFDKTLQLFLDEAGNFGATYEHTPAEGPPVAVLLNDLQLKLRANKFPQVEQRQVDGNVWELNFELTAADRKAIDEASHRIDVAAKDIECRTLRFGDFGKNVPKLARISPDSFIQMSFQVAFYRLHGRLPPTYETATLRKFREGRTDTIRLPTRESAAFVEAFAGPVVSRPDSELLEMFVNACESHKKYSLMAMNGQAMDRHILGLKLIAAENNLPLPPILRSPAVAQLFHFLVSTSQVPTETETKMGFGPSAPDCYGCCYNPREHMITFSVTAYNSCNETSARRFGEEVSRALREFHNLLVSTGRIVAKPKL